MGVKTGVRMPKQMKKDNLGLVDQQDFDFISQRSTALLLSSPKGASKLIVIIFLFLAFAIYWAANAQIDEITKGDGKVVSSKQLQKLQSLEGGIVSEVLVSSGDKISKDDVLLVVDDTKFKSDLEEVRKKLRILEAQKESFSSELSDEPLIFSEDLSNELPVITKQEMDFFATRQKEKDSIELTYKNQIKKLDNSFTEFTGRAKNLRKNVALAEEEIEIYRSLQDNNLVSKVELIALEKELNTIKGQLFQAEIKAKQIETLKTEARNERESSNLSMRNKAQEKLKSTLTEIEILKQSEVVALDRLNRTLIRSPVNGIVQRVLASTISSVISPGEDLIEIVPIDDALLIEAKIRPIDIGFLSPGQDVIVKFSAYDFTIYGGLKGNLEYISADTVVNNDESYYLIKVRTERNYLDSEKERLEIIPGMTASVNIVTGKKSVLDYILKPVLRAKHNSLHER
jgi:adhesin transport system membrane fusion protein